MLQRLGTTRSRWAAGLLCCLGLLQVEGCAWRATRVQPGNWEEDSLRRIAEIVRELQMDLEASSSGGVLGQVDRARFGDYAAFQEMIERLGRQDAVRVFLRQLDSEVKGETARTELMAEMQVSRRDSAGEMEQRRERLVLELRYGEEGWKIVEILPRDFFRPL
jgi:hypothetical protein